MSFLRHIRWPWDSSEAARHLERVREREVDVNRTLRKVAEIKDPLGEAIARALEAKERSK